MGRDNNPPPLQLLFPYLVHELLPGEFAAVVSPSLHFEARLVEKKSRNEQEERKERERKG